MIYKSGEICVMLKRILESKNIKNGIWLYLLQFFNTIMPLVTLPYVTRVLGQSGYGTFSIALNIITYLQVLVEYGFGMSATRDIAILEYDNRTICKKITRVILSRIILFGISIAVSLLYLIITNASSVLWLSLLVMLTCLLGNCIQQNWLFQGMQDMRYISLINIFSRVTTTILIFIFVKTANDIVVYSLLYSISSLISGFLGFFIAIHKYKLYIVKVTFEDVIDELKRGWFVFTTQLSAKVFGSIGITFLGLFSSEIVVGTFSAIQKIPNIIMFAWAPISQVLYPIICQQMKESYAQGRRCVIQYQKKIMPFFLLICIIIAAFSNSIVRVAFGAGYEEFSYWIIPLLGWLILGINNNFLGVQTLLSSGHDKEYSICFQVSVGCTIVLNFVLIRYFEGNGAALAPLISEAILTVLLHYQIRKIQGAIK